MEQLKSELATVQQQLEVGLGRVRVLGMRWVSVYSCAVGRAGRSGGAASGEAAGFGGSSIGAQRAAWLPQREVASGMQVPKLCRIPHALQESEKQRAALEAAASSGGSAAAAKPKRPRKNSKAAKAGNGEKVSRLCLCV